MEPTSSACAQDMEARTHAETGVSRYKASQLSFNIQLPGTRRADAHGGQSCLGRSRRRAQDKRQAGEGETFCPKKEPGPSGWLIGIPGCCFVVGVAGRVKVGVEKSYCQGTRTCRRLHENSDMGNSLAEYPHRICGAALALTNATCKARAASVPCFRLLTRQPFARCPPG